MDSVGIYLVSFGDLAVGCSCELAERTSVFCGNLGTSRVVSIWESGSAVSVKYLSSV